MPSRNRNHPPPPAAAAAAPDGRVSGGGPIHAFTVADVGRLAAALALARSYLRWHPKHWFTIVQVAPEAIDSEEEDRVEFIDFREVPVPDPGTFHYRFAVDELCDALVPFAFMHLFDSGRTEVAVYVDPESMVFAPMDAIWRTPARWQALLVPRTRKPDPQQSQEHPDVQRGLYDTGLVAMRRGGETSALLEWWAGAILDPTVATGPDGCPGNVLDPAPLFFHGLEVVDHPGYGVGHWNLHERGLGVQGEEIMVDDHPLVCFHFRGLDRTCPEFPVQARAAYRLDEWDELAVVCATWFEAIDGIPPVLGDGHLLLINGVPVTRTLNRVVSRSIARAVPMPSPGLDSDRFCAYATRPDPALYGEWIAPVVGAVLEVRPDIGATCPGAYRDLDDAAFLHWLHTFGAREEGLELMLARWGGNLTRDDGLTTALELYRARPEVQQTIPGILHEPEAYRRYGEWLAQAALFEGLIGHEGLDEYLYAQGGLGRVLDTYFSDPGLLERFPLLHSPELVRAMAGHLARTLPDWPRLRGVDLVMFAAAGIERRHELVLACLHYNPRVRDAIGGLPSPLLLDRIDSFLHGAGVDPETLDAVHQALMRNDWIDVSAQYASFLHHTPEVSKLFPIREPDVNRLERLHYVVDEHGHAARGHPHWLRWTRNLLEAQQDAEPAQGIHLWGPLQDATGLGESARGLARAMQAADIDCVSSTLPSRYPGIAQQDDYRIADRFGRGDAPRPINLIVATADSQPRIDTWLPRHALAGSTNVGYWVWETESLPRRYRDAARGLTAIMTPSTYSAKAIASTIDIPVHVVPNCPDFAALDRARPARDRFGLPADALLFGFFFDTKSVLARKNPAAVIEAFSRAFGEHQDAALVLKVNTPLPGDREYEWLKFKASCANIIWLERTLSSDETFDLMASLDVYVSLHRAEGFGLTLAEAMALGKPVIATGYSGNMDFMDGSTALLVDHTVTTSDRTHAPYPAGSRWAAPDPAHAARLMQACEAPEVRARIGAAASSAVRRTLDPGTIGNLLADHAEAILGDARSHGCRSIRPAHPVP